jgi:hypothetical protein
MPIGGPKNLHCDSRLSADHMQGCVPLDGSVPRISAFYGIVVAMYWRA